MKVALRRLEIGGTAGSLLNGLCDRRAIDISVTGGASIDSYRREGRLSVQQTVPLLGSDARFVTNLIAPANAPSAVRRYGRDPHSPACHGVRADTWTQRWVG